MQSSNQPEKISLPFATSGQKQPIPVASQIGIEDGRASYSDGFPPLTRTPLAAGGVPPFGTDMNGILNAITLIQQWQSAGGMFTFDAAFAASIGGYAKGAMLVKADGSGYWRNNVENNVSNPDTGGADWAAIVQPSSSSVAGLIQLATQAEVNARAVTTKAVAPGTMGNGTVYSFGTNGYIIFPTWLGSFCIQWGSTPPIPSGGNTTVPFTVPFANNVFASYLTYANNASDVPADSNYVGVIRSMLATKLVVRNLGPNPAQFYYLAVGF